MTKSRIVVLVALVAMVVAFFALGLQRYLSLEFFQAQRAAIDAYRAAQPVTTAAAYFAVYVAVTALSLPSLIMLKRVVKARLLATFFAIVVAGIVVIGLLFNATAFLFI